MEDSEILDGLRGHSIIDTYNGESCVQLTLDDGRILIVFGLGILMPGDHVLQ